MHPSYQLLYPKQMKLVTREDISNIVIAEGIPLDLSKKPQIKEIMDMQWKLRMCQAQLNGVVLSNDPQFRLSGYSTNDKGLLLQLALSCYREHIGTNNLAINLLGNYNNVDTLAQGHDFRIEPAYKPNMRVKMERLNSDIERTKMILGTAYDNSKSQDFSADNGSITPLILKSAPEKIFNFKFWFESTPFKRNSSQGWNLYK